MLFTVLISSICHTPYLLRNAMEIFSTFLLLITLSLFTSTPALAAGVPLDEFLPNGSFEKGPQPTDLNGTVIMGKHSLPKWVINGHVEYRNAGTQPDGMFYNVLHGVHAIRLGKNASISQTVPVKLGSFYSVTVRASWTCPLDQEILRVSVPPQSGDLPLQNMDRNSLFGGDTFAWGFKATSKTAKLTLHNPAGMEEDPTCGPLVDAVGIKELTPPRPTKANLVKNGGFEEGPLLFQNSTEGVLLAPQGRTSTLPGWIVENPKVVRFIDSKHYDIPIMSELYAVELIAGRESAITQVIRTIARKKYNLTFVVGAGNKECIGDLMIEVHAANATFSVPFTSAGYGGYMYISRSFKADSARTNITFYSSFYHTKPGYYGALCGPVIDQIMILPSRGI